MNLGARGRHIQKTIDVYYSFKKFTFFLRRFHFERLIGNWLSINGTEWVMVLLCNVLSMPL